MNAGRLADSIDFVIGVDTHKASHTIAVVDPAGGEHGHLTDQTTAFGYRRMLRYAREKRLQESACGPSKAPVAPAAASPRTCSKPGRRWRRSTGPPGPRAATAPRPTNSTPPAPRAKRSPGPTWRNPAAAASAKPCACCCAPAKAPSTPNASPFATSKPCWSPHPARYGKPQQYNTHDLLSRCARLRTRSHPSSEHRATLIALRSTARRALALEAEANDLETGIEELVAHLAPALLREPGVGVLTAAELILAWSTSGRVRSEAAFAMMAGAAPIPASSGQVTRHRLNRHGDRHVNCALHTIALNRLTYHQETREYAHRRAAEGKSDREIRRCLKRYLARRLFKILEHQHIVARPPAAT